MNSRPFYLRTACLGFVAVVALTVQRLWMPKPPLPCHIAAAEQALAELPASVGPWQVYKEGDLEPRAQKMLCAASQLSRTYYHRRSGDVVHLVVVIGPAGPVAAHSPASCFASRYARTKPARRTIACNSTVHHQCWLQYFREETAASPSICVAYAWHDGRHWSAPDWPRFAFAGHTLLAKLQVATPAKGPEGQAKLDNFLRDAMPLLNDHLAPALQTTRGSGAS